MMQPNNNLISVVNDNYSILEALKIKLLDIKTKYSKRYSAVPNSQDYGTDDYHKNLTAEMNYYLKDARNKAGDNYNLTLQGTLTELGVTDANILKIAFEIDCDARDLFVKTLLAITGLVDKLIDNYKALLELIK